MSAVVPAFKRKAAAKQQRQREIDDRAWLLVLPLMRQGGRLVRQGQVGRHYVNGYGGISEVGVKRLLAAGTIRPFLRGYVLAEVVS
jgi:hypothetical protein